MPMKLTFHSSFADPDACKKTHITPSSEMNAAIEHLQSNDSVCTPKQINSDDFPAEQEEPTITYFIKEKQRLLEKMQDELQQMRNGTYVAPVCEYVEPYKTLDQVLGEHYMNNQHEMDAFWDNFE